MWLESQKWNYAEKYLKTLARNFIDFLWTCSSKSLTNANDKYKKKMMCGYVIVNMLEDNKEKKKKEKATNE